ncbi:hypothetical protein [Kingella negevensis]|uniref:hypothetical protein n=1 Tax=Kingella negevensis TaxID=1522312 RepID=UPI00050A2A4D|nr:hypothetical protein [Kingella negevensis]MDK4689455.1 cell division protein [Kingella negevensis]WII90181.1 cell division protein [Kingella negevensis]
MKWLFATLVALNLIVFAGMIASKIYPIKKAPAQVAQQAQQPQPTVIINTTGAAPAAQATSASATVTTATANTATAATPAKRVTPPTTNNTKPSNSTALTQPKTNNTSSSQAVTTGTAQANYRNCSASVSMPEDDYHRIKGLLKTFPHAATRQVIDGSEGNHSSARMNVLFMSVSDQEAGTIQGIVGRYGSLRRSPCGK